MARCCAEKRLLSIDCVKRSGCIFALFPFDSLLNHPEVQHTKAQRCYRNAADTRDSMQFGTRLRIRTTRFNAIRYKLCSEHIIRSPIRKANIRPVWRKRENEKMRNEVNSMRENFLDKQTQALRARERKTATLSPPDVCQSRLS